MPTREPLRAASLWLMHRVPRSLAPGCTPLHRQSDPTSLDPIQSGMQQLNAQTASINADAKALQAQAMRLHPAVQRCEHSDGRALVSWGRSTACDSFRRGSYLRAVTIERVRKRVGMTNFVFGRL